MGHVLLLEVAEGLGQLKQHILAEEGTAPDGWHHSLQAALLGALEQQVYGGVVGAEDVVDEAHNSRVGELSQDAYAADEHPVAALLLNLVALVSLKGVLLAWLGEVVRVYLLRMRYTCPNDPSPSTRST